MTPQHALNAWRIKMGPSDLGPLPIESARELQFRRDNTAFQNAVLEFFITHPDLTFAQQLAMLSTALNDVVRMCLSRDLRETNP